jgi:hypothetical protein
MVVSKAELVDVVEQINSKFDRLMEQIAALEARPRCSCQTKASSKGKKKESGGTK